MQLPRIHKTAIQSIGAALSVAGIPLGMYMDFIYKKGPGWIIIFMLLSFFFIASWKNILKLRFPSYISTIGWVLLFQVIMVFYGIVSGNMKMQYLIYHLYVISMCFAYSSIKDFPDTGEIIKAIYWISLPCILGGAVLCYLGLVVGESAYLYEQANEESYNLDTLTISNGVLNFIYATICYPNKKKVWKILLIPTIIISVYVLLTCSKRTPIILLLISILYYLYCKRTLNFQLTTKKIKYSILFIVVIFVSYYSIEFVQVSIDKLIDSLYNGVSGLLGSKTVDAGASVNIRLENRQWALNYIENEFSFINYIVGGGYLIRWIDFPILEAYMDMGIIGLVFYTMLIVVYPLYIILKRINNNGVIIASMIALYGTFGIISTGNPYLPHWYVRICLLAFIYHFYKKRKNIYKQSYQ